MKCTNEKIPYFNSPVYLENKEKIGKVDEIFGPIQDYFISVKVRLFEFFVTNFSIHLKYFISSAALHRLYLKTQRVF